MVRFAGRFNRKLLAVEPQELSKVLATTPGTPSMLNSSGELKALEWLK
jgi:hypothetical protein